jgi:hypothetical protein
MPLSLPRRSDPLLTWIDRDSIQALVGIGGCDEEAADDGVSGVEIA